MCETWATTDLRGGGGRADRKRSISPWTRYSGLSREFHRAIREDNTIRYRARLDFSDRILSPTPPQYANIRLAHPALRSATRKYQPREIADQVAGIHQEFRIFQVRIRIDHGHILIGRSEPRSIKPEVGFKSTETGASLRRRSLRRIMKLGHLKPVPVSTYRFI